MKRFKSTLLAVLFTILSLIIIFTLELFLNGEQTEYLSHIIFIVSIIIFIYGLILTVSGKSSFKFVKGRVTGFLIMCSVSIFFIGFMFISAFNTVIYEGFRQEFTPVEKLQMYKKFNAASKEIKEYDLDIESYLKELNREKVNDIDIYYSDEIKIEHLNTIKETIPLAESLVEDIFGNLEKQPLKVIFYDEKERFRQEISKSDRVNSDLVQGYFDGQNIHIKKFTDEQELWGIESHFIHEYTHYAYNNYFLKNNIYKHMPVWFDEGVAEYTAIYEKNMEYSVGYFENSMDLRKLQTTEEFIKALESGQNIDKFYDPYVHSYYMIDSLVDMKEQKVITEIISKSKDMDFYEAFENIVGVDIEEYQNVNLVEYVEKKQLR